MSDPSLNNLLQSALNLQQAGSFEAAEAIYRSVLKRFPGQPDALHLLALICKSTGRSGEAEKLMLLSLQSSPGQPHVLNNFGNLLASLGRLDEAIRHYRKATGLAPAYSDAWRNLGLALMDDSRPAEAIPALLKALVLSPGNAEITMSLGVAYKESGDVDRAVQLYEKVLAANPHHARALHNLGVSLDFRYEFKAAAQAFTKAVAADAMCAESWLGLGNAYGNLGAAAQSAEAFRTAIKLKPDYAEAHESLSKLLWTLGEGEKFLNSYPPAIASAPKALKLRQDYAALLLQSGRHSEAERVLAAALESLGPEVSTLRLMGRALSNLGRTGEAAQAFARAVQIGPQNLAARNDYARFLIAGGEYTAALAELGAVGKMAPSDQGMWDQEVWAYRGLSWRLLSDARADWLNDVENLVVPFRLQVPPGFADITAFNQALKAELDKLHGARTHPIDQSLVGGTQTRGALFAEKSPAIKAFRASLELSIADYIKGLGDDPTHPLLSRKSKDFRFAGSWSVRLRSQGHHINHVHPQGWISSAYYVALPEVVKSDPNSREGWIKFGESNLALGGREKIARMIRPEEGLLVLFPSYMWHGTVPFAGDEPRVTIAFDVVPA